MVVFVFLIALRCPCICLLACSKVCSHLFFGLLSGVFVFVFWLALGCVVLVFSFVRRCVCVCLLVCSKVSLYLSFG